MKDLELTKTERFCNAVRLFGVRWSYRIFDGKKSRINIFDKISNLSNEQILLRKTK